MNDATTLHSGHPVRLLRIALLGNALFSICSGLVMLVAPNLVGEWLGIQADWIYRALGFGLLLFGADLTHQATRRRMASWRGLLSSVADFAWVGGTILLVAFAADWFSSGGLVLLLAVAGVVLFFGVLQLVGVVRLHRLPGSGGLYRHCVLVESGVAAPEMWKIVARLGEISRFMPMLKSSSLRGDLSPGKGCVRQCEDQSGKQWAEECTSFDPAARSFEVRFLCDEPGFPFPATAMRGGWEVIPTGADSCETMVWWELAPNPRWLAPVLMPVLAFQADRDFPKVISNMAAEAAGADLTKPNALRTPVRLVPRFC